MKKIYKAKIVYIEPIKGYIILVNIDGDWCRCGSGNNSIVVWDFEEDAEVYIEECDSLELFEE